MSQNHETARAIVNAALAAHAAPEDLLARAHRLERHRFDNGVATVDLVRHPCFPIPYQPMNATTAHFLIRTRCIVRDGALVLTGEAFEGIAGGACSPDWWAEFNARDHVRQLEAREIREFESEGAVAAWAVGRASVIAEIIDETSYAPEWIPGVQGAETAWRDWMDSYVVVWCAAFVVAAAEVWREEVAGSPDDALART